MLEIADSIDRPTDIRTSLISFMVSVFVHSLLLVLLWFLVYATMERKEGTSIFLTGSIATPNQAVAFDAVGPTETLPRTDIVEQTIPVAEVARSPAPTPTVAVSSKTLSDSESLEPMKEPATSITQPVAPSIEFFGTRAYGSRFVFLVDISHSMNARDGERYRRAYEELARSVENLQPEQSYYVYLFSWKLTPMFYDSSSREYVAAVPGHIKRLKRWISGISLGSGTDPRRALSLAAHQKPDAVFLLSDGHFNKPPFPLSETGWISEQGDVSQENVVAGVKRFYGNLPIHTIAFENPFAQLEMQQIAAMTGGEHRYVETESHHPIDANRFRIALRHVDDIRRDKRQQYRARLSHAREFIRDGEHAYAEYLVRPLRKARPAEIVNEKLRSQVFEILDAELGDTRLEDFEDPPELLELLAE
ncbi:MAG: hypothetical protein AB8B91_24960 [Rubripirellula sp.]